MRTHEISCVPVVGEQGELVGLLTESYLVRLARPLIKKFLEQPNPRE
jgi:CBS domain-containing protein